MTQRSRTYEHALYNMPYVYGGPTVVGANGVGPRHVAFTDQKIVAVHQAPVVASTAAGSQPLLFKKSGTTTTTTTLTVLTSGSIAPILNELATPVTLARGDQFWMTHGTDATAVVGNVIETQVVAGANVTQ